MDAFTSQITVQVHLTETDRVGLRIPLANRRYRVDRRHIADRSETANSGADRTTDVIRIHCQGDIHRTEVAGDVFTDVLVAEVGVVVRRRVHLQNLAAQVRHVDATVDRVCPVHSVFEHDVRVSRLELQLSECLEELARIDLRLADAGVIDHLVVVFADRDVTKRLAVDPLDVVGREQVHRFVALGEVEGDVRDYDTE